MDVPEPGKITSLLKAWREGDTGAREQLIPVVYGELHRLARRYRRYAGAGETLQTTALVHEAYLRLVKIEEVNWQDRVHFFAVSAQLMRRILVDSARARAAAKRGGGQAECIDWLELQQLPAPGSDQAAGLIALDDALKALARLDPQRAQIVELRVFGGLTVEETAQALGLSPPTVMRYWKFAKAWLLRELSGTKRELP